MDSKKKRRIAFGVLGVLIIAGVALTVFWKMNGPKVIAAVNEAILTRAGQAVNGKLTAEGLDFTLFGSTAIHKMALYDAKNNLMASSDEVIVDFSFADMISGNLSLDKVKSISFEGLKVNLSRDKTGRWNAEDILKPQPADKPMNFRGKILVSKGTAIVTNVDDIKQFDKVEGSFDFETFPAIKTDLKGNLGDSALTAKGNWAASGVMAMNLQASTFEMSQLMAYIPSIGKTKLLAGQLKDFTITLSRDKGAMVIGANGAVTGLNVDLDGVKLTEGQGKVKFADQILDIQDTTLVYAGQKISVGGKVDLTQTQPRLNLNVAGSGFNLASMSDNSQIQGTASFKAVLGGTPETITANGDFQIPSGSISSTAFTDAAGIFSYAGDVMTIDQTTLKSMGGALNLSGTLNRKTSQFRQKVTGQGIDAGQMSEKAIQGKVDFTAMVTGQDSANAIADGSFSMPSAVISGTTFSNISGQFVKRAKTLDLSNVNLTTSGQKLTVRGQVTVDAGKTGLNLNISSSGMDVSAFQPNAPLKGPVAFQAAVVGTPDKHSVAGSFQIASGQLGILQFTSGSGNFHFADDVLTIESARANALGGAITTAGTVTKAGAYNQKVTGQNVNAALVTDGDVQGRADFTTTVSGQGDFDKANADGNFSMGSGSVNNIPFSSMNGNFLKRGPQIDFPKLDIKFVGGIVDGSGHTEGDYLLMKLTPGTTPLAIILGPKLNQYIPQGDMKIRFSRPK